MELMEYNWYYRTVQIWVDMGIPNLIRQRMDEDETEHFEALVMLRGLRQFVANPFMEDWMPFFTSPFGYRIHPISHSREMHTGIDIGRPTGTPLHAGLDGVIYFAGDRGGYGNTVIIDAFFEDMDTYIRLLYAHMHEIHVAVDDIVEIGDVIGVVGSTGNSTGPHLHMEVMFRDSGDDTWQLLNPLFFVESWPPEEDDD